MPYPNLTPPGQPPLDQTVPPDLHARILKEMGRPRPDYSPQISMWGLPLNAASASQSQQAVGAWDTEYNTRLQRALTPLSVGQVAEPQRSQFATPEQFRTQISTEPSQVPSMGIQALQPPSMHMGGPQAPLLPAQGIRSLVPPQQEQGPFVPEPGPPQQIARQVLDPTQPANPAQRQAFEANIALSSKWPPGMGWQSRMNRKQEDMVRAIMARNPNMSPDEAMAMAQANTSGLTDQEIRTGREDRLGEGFEERKRRNRVMEDQGQQRIDNMVKQHKESLSLRLRALDQAKEGKLSERDLHERRVAALEGMNRLRGLYIMLKTNPNLSPEAIDAINQEISDLNEMEMTFREDPGFFGGLFGSTKETVLTPKSKSPQKSAAPQGAAPSGDVVTDSEGKQWKYKGVGDRKDKSNYTQVK